jgi:hypothetical protein
MAVRSLACALWVVVLATSGVRAETSHSCSEEFWKRATTVATGHGANFEFEARQIARMRCDCTFAIGKPKACNASTVSASEALAPMGSGEVGR